MRPVPIPDACIGPGVRRMVIGPPGGDLTNERIRPVEVLAAIVGTAPRISVLVAFEPGGLNRLVAMPNPGLWLTFMTARIAPFSVEVAGGQAVDPL